MVSDAHASDEEDNSSQGEIAEVKIEKDEDITRGCQVIELNRYLFNGIV